MKITHAENSFVIEYNDAESLFIETLSEKQKRYIRMGLATVYDYGFKAEEE